jgi:hypothetical protein
MERSYAVRCGAGERRQQIFFNWPVRRVWRVVFVTCSGRGRWHKPEAVLFWCGNLYSSWYYLSSTPPEPAATQGASIYIEGFALSMAKQGYAPPRKPMCSAALTTTKLNIYLRACFINIDTQRSVVAHHRRFT